MAAGNLVERRLLNAGSQGAPAWHLALVPEDPSDLAGSKPADVAEVGPCQLPDVWWRYAAGPSLASMAHPGALRSSRPMTLKPKALATRLPLPDARPRHLMAGLRPGRR